MDKDDITEKMKKLFKDNKNLSNLVAIILVLIFILIAVNIFKPKLTAVTASSNNTEKKDSTESKTKEVSYEEEQKEQLIAILKKIDGCGNIDCMLTFSSGDVKVPARDETRQNNVTEENDKDGGKRTTTQQNDNSKVVMSNKDGNNEPFILETQKPKVTGVVVVSEGAKDGKVKADIEKAVTNLYDLPANKVNVYSMK